MTVLVTGGAGFIGSALVKRLIGEGQRVVNFDLLTYAANLRNLEEVENSPLYTLVHGDVANADHVGAVLEEYRPSMVFHLAAETHVDRSIDGPRVFADTNIVGTVVMLDAALEGRSKGILPAEFRFVHVSTDEVYGSLGESGLFTEETAYAPNSPYSASKASADHLVRSWHHTYGLPVIISNCSNNYGPYQSVEKFIPTVIANGLLGRPIPIYGDGQNVRDWLYVDDHVDALSAVASKGRIGQKYNVGGNSEMQNIEVARKICAALDQLRPRATGSYASQITLVRDRPGHDRRYAIDSTKIRQEIGWHPKETFDTGIARTIKWYCANENYWWTTAEAAKRLGLAGG